jgi:DNA-binding GntR family transcriptional regulator
MSSMSPPVGLSHQPLRQAVQDAIREAIVLGRFQQGERLLEDHLAQELEVSRNPVREALQALAAEGFVVLEPRRGARVATVSRKRAEELFELREALEGLVSKLAARRRSEEQLDELRMLVAAGLDAAEAGRLRELPELNTRFHRALAAASGNEMLADEVSRLSHVVAWIYAERIQERSSGSWVEHAAIVDAIERQDEDEALRCAAVHIARARAAYLADDSGAGLADARR